MDSRMPLFFIYRSLQYLKGWLETMLPFEGLIFVFYEEFV